MIMNDCDYDCDYVVMVKFYVMRVFAARGVLGVYNLGPPRAQVSSQLY